MNEIKTDKIAECLYSISEVEKRKMAFKELAELCLEIESSRRIIEVLDGKDDAQKLAIAVALHMEVRRLQYALKVSEQDSERIDYLETCKVDAEVSGGSDDGERGVFWGVGSSMSSLRETVDALMDAEKKSSSDEMKN